MSSSFADFMAEQMQDPQFAHAVEEARARSERSVQVSCHFGYCIHELDPLDGKIHGGMGPMMCPCDHLPGWKSERIAGQARPAVPVRARGRHGSRVQRSTRRHRLPDYRSVGPWLPPVPPS